MNVFFGQVIKKYRISQRKFGHYFTREKMYVLILTKNVLGYILGDSVTISSGHPGPTFAAENDFC
jgi:hypothetical protein